MQQAIAWLTPDSDVGLAFAMYFSHRHPMSRYVA